MAKLCRWLELARPLSLHGGAAGIGRRARASAVACTGNENPRVGGSIPSRLPLFLAESCAFPGSAVIRHCPRLACFAALFTHAYTRIYTRCGG